MLKNAPTLAIRGVDTAENEPSEVSMKGRAQTGAAPVLRQKGKRKRELDTGINR